MLTAAERQYKYRQANLEMVRERERLNKWWTKYGVTPEAWQAMFDKQGGRCAGCSIKFGKTRSELPCIDHNHETMEFRGLLCHSCNRSLGLLKENITTLQNLILYLQG